MCAHRPPHPGGRSAPIAAEAAQLGVSEIFVTGGEPLPLADLPEILAARAVASPTTVLTNGMLLWDASSMLRSLSRDCVTLQISLDSPTPERHDRPWGQATWTRALAGIEHARGEGFRVRLAATVSTDEVAEEFRRFLDAQQIAEQDRVIRHIAPRGFATEGIALAPADLVPEVSGAPPVPPTLPTKATCPSRSSRLPSPFAAVRRAFDQEREHSHRLGSIFNCA